MKSFVPCEPQLPLKNKRKKKEEGKCAGYKII